MMDPFDAAASAFGPIENREQDDLEYLFMLGISYGKLKRAGDAQRRFARLVDAGGDAPHLHLRRSQSESRMPEMGRSGLMSGDGKRGDPQASVLTPILDSTPFC